MNPIKIDKKSKFLFAIFFIFFVISVVLTYKRYISDRNFDVISSEPAEG